MRGFFFFNKTYFRKLTPVFLNVETIECFVSKEAIKITEIAINRCFLKKAKSKKVGKIHQN